VEMISSGYTLCPLAELQLMSAMHILGSRG
jgi:hypothetical protein